MRLKAILAALGLCFIARPIVAQVWISEFMTAGSALKDEDGSTPDWIEIWNTDGSTVNLNGWHLTDKTGNLTKWTFPATNVASGQFLVVFASGKNRAVAGAPLHTNFKLSSSGEYPGAGRTGWEDHCSPILAAIPAAGLWPFVRHPIQRPNGELGGPVLCPTDSGRHQFRGVPWVGWGRSV